MKNFYRLIIPGMTAVLLAAASHAHGAQDPRLDILRSLQLNNSKIPILNQGKLQMVIFSEKAERRGSMIVGFDTVLALIHKGADADAIRDDWNIKPYRLGAPLPTVLDFWRKRIVYCDGIMQTPESEIDVNGQRASGSRDVHFRSPLLDLDGVGFDADFNRGIISINSRVRIILRHQRASSPAELLKNPGKLPAKYEYITARSDSMLIDSKRNEVMLIGNVRVDEAQGFLTCHRLTIFWKNNSGDKIIEKEDPEAELRNSGVDRILADGDVIITKRSNTKEQIFADHLICDIPKGTAKLSGDEKFPRMVFATGEVISGKDIYFERNSGRGLITGGCRIDGAPEKNAKGELVASKGLSSDKGFFNSEKNMAEFSGDVVIRDSGRTIKCSRLLITTADRADGKPTAKKTPAANDPDQLLGGPDLGLGSKEIKGADFYEHVVLQDPSGSQLECDRMHTDFTDRNAIKSADCYGHVAMIDASKSKLTCEVMHADFASGPGGGSEIVGAQWSRNVRVESAGDAGTPQGTLTADRGELDMPGNRVTFESNVIGTREKSTLKCQRLDLYLSAKSGDAPAAAPASGSIAIGAGNGRMIRKVVASDKVRITDASGSLDSDKLTLFFSELPRGAKPEPGMLQAGDSYLTDILAEGHVVAVNQASADSQKEPGILSGKSSGTRKIYADSARADLTRHLSHLHGSVKIHDDESAMNCDEMFLYGVRRMSAAAAAAAKQDDPDADPFALPGFTEDSVPSVINITDDVQLKKVLCLGNVALKRIDPDTKRTQEAGGNRCVYMPEKQVVVLTDTPPRRPWLRAEGRQQYSSRIVYDLKGNIFKSFDTDTFTIGAGDFAP